MRVYYILIALLMIGIVNALTINSPQEITYDTNNILLNITNNETLESVIYSVDNGENIIACLNCSSFETILNLSEGTHNITITVVSGNETIHDNKFLVIDTPPIFDVIINNPENNTYNESFVKLNISSDKNLDEINYKLNDDNVTVACANCSRYETTLNLIQGNYSLIIFGELESVIKNATVDFEVVGVIIINESPETITKLFTLSMISPVSKIYYEKNVEIDVIANETLDNLYAEVDGKNLTCTNCSRINTTLEFEKGNYTIKAKGILKNMTEELIINFSILDKENKTYMNDTPRFDIGFEKLPKMVESGEINDSELADIIRNNKLNPGVLNRIIKTGKLRNESINAILDKQTTPPGIFKKMFGWMGFKNTYSSKIAHTYNLTDDTKEKIVRKEDLPKRTKEKIEQEITIKKTPPGQIKKQVNTIQSGNVSMDTNRTNGKNKFPQGQTKKNK